MARAVWWLDDDENLNRLNYKDHPGLHCAERCHRGGP